MFIKARFKIVEMNCTNCAISIDGDLEDVKGVKKAETSYAKLLTEVEYDPSEVGPQKLLAIIKKSGYDAILTEK